MHDKASQLELENTAALKIDDPQARLVEAARFFSPGEAVELFIFDETLRKFKSEIISSAKDRIELKVSAAGDFTPTHPLPVVLINFKTKRLYYLEGLLEPVPERTGWLIVNHQDRALCTQRRLFHRFHFRKKIHLTGITLPDGSQVPDMSATLQDCSLIGLGIQAKSKLPPNTIFKSPDLFKTGNTEIDNIEFCLQIIWSRGNRLFGFRHGAVFKFQYESEQNNFSRIIERMQLKYLADGLRSIS